MRFVSMLYAITLGAPALASAQTPGNPEWPVQAGSRVRILSPVFGDRGRPSRSFPPPAMLSYSAKLPG